MKHFLAALLFTVAIQLQAETVTPLDQPLTEGSEITITCELTQAPSRGDFPVFDSSKECDSTKGIWHYKLYLPTGYLADTTKKWPCMFIMSPGGNAKMGKMQNYLTTKGFVVVMAVESQNGPWGPVVGNLLAAHDDVIKRVRVQEGLKFATGHSGGARGTSLLVQGRPGFAGIIMQSAGAASDNKGFITKNMKSNSNFYVAMTMGTSDKNRDEISRMKSSVNASRFKSFDFSGGHEWAPADVFEQAMAWLEEKTPLGKLK
jgi:hypothetical protein